MSLTKLPKELGGSGPSRSHAIAWSLLHIIASTGVKVIEEKSTLGCWHAWGSGYQALHLVKVLGIKYWGSGWKPHWVSSVLPSPSLGWHSLLNGCLLFPVHNDPWDFPLLSTLGTCCSKCLQKTISLSIIWSLFDMQNLWSHHRLFELESAFYQDI